MNEFPAIERTRHGIELSVGAERLRVEVVAPDVVRLHLSTQGGWFDPHPTYALVGDPFGEPVPHDVRVEGGAVHLATTVVVVSVRLDPLAVDVHRTDGSVVFEAYPDAAQTISRPHADSGFGLARRKSPHDGIYGLGEKTGAFDRNGRSFTMWNLDVLNPHESEPFASAHEPGSARADNTSTEFDPYYMSVPLMYHHPNRVGPMSASFIDNAYRATYDLTPADHYRVEFSDGQWVEYVFAGPDMPRILQAYTALTGRMAMPPDWALGYHQCRWKVYTQDDVLALAQRLREADVPCDSLWLDIEYMDGYRVFTWHPERFPDPQGMLKTLAEQGFHVVTIIDPGVKQDPGYRVYDDGLARDVFAKRPDGQVYIGQVWPGDTAFPDFSRQEARDWWGRLNAEHVRSGVAGIWNDMNEPATGNVPAEGMWFEDGTVPHAPYHNQYALLMAMGTWDGLEQAMPGEPKFILSRAGFAGLQRYAANWLGDNQSRWDHLALSVPMACGLGVSGQPFVGADCGGFQGDSNAELFDRWMQMGAFTPFFRNHTEINTIDQYPWSFGPAVLEHVRAAVKLRYAIMPYIRQAFATAADTGEPIQRPYVFDHQHDPVAATVEDAYLFGRDLLVAPVTQPGQRTRRVYLPEGRWRELATGTEHGGIEWLEVVLRPDAVPLFTRVGSALDDQLR